MASNDILTLAKNARHQTAEEFVKALLLDPNHPDQILNNMVGESPRALSLLLPASRNRRVLEVGAGPGSLIHHFRSAAGSFLLADSSYDRLSFSKHFHNLRDQGSAISYLQVREIDLLPLRDDSFDCAVLHLAHIAPEATAILLAEIRRVLCSSGQVLLIVENLLNWERLSPPQLLNSPSFSFIGYQRLLKKAGFPQSNHHALVYHDSFLRKVIHFTGSTRVAQKIPSARSGSVKTRLKQGILATKYAVISGTSERPSQLDSIIEDASQKLTRAIGDGNLTVQDHEITRKEKVVLFGRWAETRLILKLPLTLTAAATETNNARVLDLLQLNAEIREHAPRALASGLVAEQPYFVESMVSGTPISELIKSHGRMKHLDDVFSLLQRLAGCASGLTTTAVVGDIYEKLVGSPITTIARITGDSNLANTLNSYFRSHLHGADLNIGLMHGDFSVSNLLYNQGQPLSVIDWETAEPKGVPALDAINFLDSLQRFCVKGTRINQTIPQLASKNWPERKELEFLHRCYELYGIDPGLHETLVYLRWLRHMGFLIQFWLRFDRRAQNTFIYDIASNLR